MLKHTTCKLARASKEVLSDEEIEVAFLAVPRYEVTSQIGKLPRDMQILAKRVISTIDRKHPWWADGRRSWQRGQNAR